MWWCIQGTQDPAGASSPRPRLREYNWVCVPTGFLARIFYPGLKKTLFKRLFLTSSDILATTFFVLKMCRRKSEKWTPLGPKNRRMKEDGFLAFFQKIRAKKSKNGHFLTPPGKWPGPRFFQKGVKPRVLKNGGGPRKENSNKKSACSDFPTYRLKAKNRVFSLFFAKKPKKSLRPEWHRHSVVKNGQNRPF